MLERLDDARIAMAVSTSLSLPGQQLGTSGVVDPLEQVYGTWSQPCRTDQWLLRHTDTQKCLYDR